MACDDQRVVRRLVAAFWVVPAKAGYSATMVLREQALDYDTTNGREGGSKLYDPAELVGMQYGIVVVIKRKRNLDSVAAMVLYY
jgi:hypothetical protein